MLPAPGLLQFVGEKEDPTQTSLSCGSGSGSGSGSRFALMVGSRLRLGSTLMLPAPGELQLVGEKEEPTQTDLSCGIGIAAILVAERMKRRNDEQRIMGICGS